MRRRRAALIGRFKHGPGLRAVAVWALPLLTIWVIYFSPRHVVSASKAITYLIAIAIALVAMRRPDRCLIGLIILLPFQGLILAWLWKVGLPASIVRHLSAWKETLGIAVVLAGAKSFIASGRHADTLDRLALGFVLLVAVYAAAQPVIVLGSPHTMSVRLLGFRETAGFVLLLLGARHAPLGPEFTRRVAKTLLGVGVVVSAIGIFEAVDSSGWNHFVVQTIRYTQYQVAILNTGPANMNDIRTFGTIGGVRVEQIGSVFLNSAFLGWYLIPPLALAVERVVRRQGSSLMVPALVLIGVAELLTQKRSAIFGAVIAVALTFPHAAGRGRHWRTQVGIVLGGLALIAIPAAIGSGLAKRVDQLGSSGNSDNSGHVNGFWHGLSIMEHHPLGLGVGTGAGTGQRYDVNGYVIPENNYIEVGDELGFAGGLLFVALMLTLLMWLRRLSRVRADPLIAAMWAAGIGLAVSAWFLQTWSSNEVAWTYWGIAGATLALARAPVSAAATVRRSGPAPAAGSGQLSDPVPGLTA